MSLAWASSLANAKQASAFCLANRILPLLSHFEPRCHLVRWHRRRPHAHCTRHGVHELTVRGTCLLNVSLRNLAELVRISGGWSWVMMSFPACTVRRSYDALQFKRKTLRPRRVPHSDGIDPMPKPTFFHRPGQLDHSPHSQAAKKQAGRDSPGKQRSPPRSGRRCPAHRDTRIIRA